MERGAKAGLAMLVARAVAKRLRRRAERTPQPSDNEVTRLRVELAQELERRKAREQSG